MIRLNSQTYRYGMNMPESHYVHIHPHYVFSTSISFNNKTDVYFHMVYATELKKIETVHFLKQQKKYLA